MNSFIIVQMLLLFVLLLKTRAVPIARAIGCGRSDPNLSPEKREYCCKSFALDCDVRDSGKPISLHAPKKVDRPSVAASVPRRGNGASCKAPYIACAAGLECRLGYCRRTRTLAHLQKLMKRGVEVEKEENMDSDHEDAQALDQEPAEDSIVVHGQSMPVGEIELQARRSMNFQTKTKKSAEQTLNSFSGIESSSGKESSQRTDEITEFMEEDELAANLADLLEANMHLSMNKSQIRDIRRLIAGTLDERAQREDEIDNTELSLTDLKPEDVSAPKKQSVSKVCATVDI